MDSGFQEKLQALAAKVQENKYLKSVTEGLNAILPVMIIGAFSSLLSGMAIEPYQNFITSTGLKPILALPSTVTLDLLSIYAVFFIAYRLSVNLDKEGGAGGLAALISFFILTPLGNVASVGADGVVTAGGGAIPTQYLGAQGLFVAIFVGLISAQLYAWVVDRGWMIKMPAGVPPTVSKSFSALIPSTLVVVFFVVIAAIFRMTSYGSAHAFVYSLVQAPLQNLGGNLYSLIIMTLVVHVLWMFGIHGMMVILPIYLTVWFALGAENLEVFNAAGGSFENLPNIVNTAFFSTFVLLGGSGATLGLNFLMLRAKSQRYKTLGRLALPGSLFGINEPIIFGMPVVLNPILAVPFILAPLANAVIPYLLMSTGIIHKLNGFPLSLGTPVIMTALLSGTIIIVVVQVLLVVLDALIYWPFFRTLDKQAYEQEQAEVVAE